MGLEGRSRTWMVTEYRQQLKICMRKVPLRGLKMTEDETLETSVHWSSLKTVRMKKVQQKLETCVHRSKKKFLMCQVLAHLFILKIKNTYDYLYAQLVRKRMMENIRNWLPPNKITSASNQVNSTLSVARRTHNLRQPNTKHQAGWINLYIAQRQVNGSLGGKNQSRSSPCNIYQHVYKMNNTQKEVYQLGYLLRSTILKGNQK